MADEKNLLARIGEKWHAVAGIVLCIAGYVELRANVADSKTRLALTAGYVDDMRLHGYPPHEQRITSLENQKFDQTAIAVQNLAKIVGDLTAAQKSDHDIIVRLVTLREKETSRTQ